MNRIQIIEPTNERIPVIDQGIDLLRLLPDCPEGLELGKELARKWIAFSTPMYSVDSVNLDPDFIAAHPIIE